MVVKAGRVKSNNRRANGIGKYKLINSWFEIKLLAIVNEFDKETNTDSKFYIVEGLNTRNRGKRFRLTHNNFIQNFELV